MKLPTWPLCTAALLFCPLAAGAQVMDWLTPIAIPGANAYRCEELKVTAHGGNGDGLSAFQFGVESGDSLIARGINIQRSFAGTFSDSGRLVAYVEVLLAVNRGYMTETRIGASLSSSLGFQGLRGYRTLRDTLNLGPTAALELLRVTPWDQSAEQALTKAALDQIGKLGQWIWTHRCVAPSSTPSLHRQPVALLRSSPTW